MSRGVKILFVTTLVVVFLFFFFFGLKEAESFLAPLLVAAILSLVVLPLSRKMESIGVKRIYSSLLNTFFLFLLSLLVMTIFSFQVKSFVDDWPKIKKTMRPELEQLKTYVFEHSALDKESLEGYGDFSTFIGPGTGQAKKAMVFFSRTMNFIGNYLLTFIYVFFLLNYRKRYKEFLLRLFPNDKQPEVRKVIQKSANVVQQYLVGKLILMALLAVVYSIGLGFSGVSNFILVSLIAAVLTLIPYIGNIIGMALAFTFGYLTSGEIGVLIGILATFTIAQFVESYILQPYVVGDKVDLHPFFVILAVVLGNVIWGVTGMIIAVPVMAIVAVTFLHIPPLHPFGFLFSKK